jgi:hypothetical protein
MSAEVPGEVELVDRRRTVVCAVALKRPAREHLESLLGDVRFVDIRESVEAADVVLSPVCSPQTIAKLKAAYPTARVIVVELEDWEHDIELGGPVTRLQKAGADAYLTAASLDDLAHQLSATNRVESAAEAIADAEAYELEAAAIDDVVLERLEAMLEQRRHRVGRPPTG